MEEDVTLAGVEYNLRHHNPFVGMYRMSYEKIKLVLPCVQRELVEAPEVIHGYLYCTCGKEVGTKDVYCRRCGQRLGEEE